MLVPEQFMPVLAKCSVELLANKFLVFQRNLVQTVALGRTFLATADLTNSHLQRSRWEYLACTK
jgi:hypothetical protein